MKVDGLGSTLGALGRVGAPIAAVFASLWLLTSFSYSGQTSYMSSSGQVIETRQTRSLLEVNGPTVLIVLSVPVMIALLPWLCRRSSRLRRPLPFVAAGYLACSCYLGVCPSVLSMCPALCWRCLAQVLASQADRCLKRGLTLDPNCC